MEARRQRCERRGCNPVDPEIGLPNANGVVVPGKPRFAFDWPDRDDVGYDLWNACDGRDVVAEGRCDQHRYRGEDGALLAITYLRAL